MFRGSFLLLSLPQKHKAVSLMWLSEKYFHNPRFQQQETTKATEGNTAGERSWKKCPVKTSWGLQACLVWRKWGWETTSLLSTVFLGRRSGDWNAELFFLVSSNRTYWEWFKAAPDEVQTGHQEHLFPERAVKHWNRLPWEMVKASSISV